MDASSGLKKIFIHVPRKLLCSYVFKQIDSLRGTRFPCGEQFYWAATFGDEENEGVEGIDATTPQQTDGYQLMVRKNLPITTWGTAKSSDDSRNFDEELKQTTRIQEMHLEEDGEPSRKAPSAQIQATKQSSTKRKAQSESEQPTKQPRINQVLCSQFLIDSCH